MVRWFRSHPLAAALAVVVVFLVWLAFRPELLFVNKSVDEPFPTASASVTNPAMQRH